jgi:DNA segregation ATPase FtsK/SpoIIIE-like protein
MATATRRTFREWIYDHVYPEWLKPKQSGPPPTGAAHPQQPQPGQTVAGSGQPRLTLIPASAPQPQSPPTVLGEDRETGEAVGLSLDERLQGLYVIGSTGTGKTTLLLNMILSDIYSNH